MGKIEKRVKKRARKENIQALILESLRMAAVMGVAITAPNAIQTLKKFGLTDTASRNSNRSLKRLLSNGLIEFKVALSGKKFLSITGLGRKKLDYLELNNFFFKKPKFWDGKWRVIIFDIKEKYRYKRDALRAYLVKIGFVKLQASVWVFPYDCEDLLLLLKTDLELGRSLLYVVADTIENDKYLREEFGLPKEE